MVLGRAESLEALLILVHATARTFGATVVCKGALSRKPQKERALFDGSNSGENVGLP